jgi:hypothetical protein
MSKLTKPTIQKESKASAAMLFAEATKSLPKVSTASGSSGRVFHAPEGHRRLTINLRDNLHKKLRLAAVERDCTATEIIEQLLEKELR